MHEVNIWASSAIVKYTNYAECQELINNMTSYLSSYQSPYIYLKYISDAVDRCLKVSASVSRSKPIYYDICNLLLFTEIKVLVLELPTSSQVPYKNSTEIWPDQ